MQKLDPKAVWLFTLQNVLGFVFLIPAILFAASVFMFSGTNIIKFLIENVSQNLLLVYLILLVINVLLSFVIAKLTYYNWKYEFSDVAVKVEKGIIWKKYISIPYERIQNVDIYRGVLARLLGLSDLQIQTAGYSGSGKNGVSTEGRLPGLPMHTAETIRDQLIHKVHGSRQGV